MKVVVTARARRRIMLVDAWWREHRDNAPDTFVDELERILLRLSATPRVGVPYAAASRPTRRLLLPKTEQYLYYRVDEARHTVIVITVWGARRGKGPGL